MKTAIDSSVLYCIAKREPGFEAWQRALAVAAVEGILVVCPVVFAEISPGRSSADRVSADLAALDIHYDTISPEAAFLAGQIHLAYRLEGGPRERLIPDFLIAAHAQVQAGRLAVVDRGYLRRYFPALKLLQPAKGN